ncbi:MULTISPECIES: phosphoglucosamine mutase [Halomicrobium]|uniref:Phosphoglucomutase/phosphomannomutase alpha/beta/alpha domain I n=2 Tax=Halomicrobium mukohataei TaxID=57705 RepID=C7P229_HALMD|nr:MULTISPECIES: phosphoglucosamine mutase [Halomicrobium]ACV47258.1 phosphoglucomutase/phosphomannomutase alpha/beta/alpha domain I [Halomicrobium mukohataei DSM 12286]QCD65730.1 phosphoglucosamine mutase [Halomicrobium mukohataei]QFR20535.1 phosphoglucosamine mutase [Halomicrobium sp. ZPS1]
MFGTSGIRGPVGEDVTAALALDVGRALGVEADRVVVGRDPRESGELLTDALAAGLRESGTDVIDLGVAATPTVARSVGWRDADAGAAITASHNPAPDNGIKLWQPSGQAFDEAGRERIAERVRDGVADLEAWDELGTRTTWDGRERHARTIADAVSLAPADAPPVAVDLGNGAGGVSVDALQELGCAVETLNAQPDGSFPGRPSEPTADNCASLSALVANTDAELGVAHDGDADRLRAATADGSFVSGDELLAVFAREAASPGDTVAVPVDTSLAVADFLAEADVAVTYTPVGDVYVAERASRPGVAFGGEPSGAWIWPDQTLCPDGPLAACRLVALHAEEPLRERVAAVPDYPIRRESIAVEDKRAVVDRLADRITAEYDDVATLDGVRVDLGDAWFLVRASGTQPLVRITAEARDEERARDAFEIARDAVAGARE